MGGLYDVVTMRDGSIQTLTLWTRPDMSLEGMEQERERERDN
jgi:hypothetical protein